MPKINFPEVQEIADDFEALVSACEAWRTFLEQRRAEYHQMQDPPHGGVRVVDNNIRRVQALLDLLEGDGYDTMRAIVDGLGILETAHKGEWV